MFDLSRITDRPIAIAYTPTEPSHIYRPAAAAIGPAYSQHGYQHPAEHGYFSHANHASSVIAEIRDDADAASATTHHQLQYDTTATSAAAAVAAHHRRVHNDTDEFGNPSRGDNYRQEFEAPFYPSVNLDKHPETIRNNWAVVTPPSQQSADAAASEETNKSTTKSAAATTSTTSTMTKAAGIDRSDSNIAASTTKANDRDGSTSGESATASSPVADSKEHFSQFQPEFQGGFRPIYPPGMKSTLHDDDGVDDGAADDVEQREIVMVQPKSNKSEPDDEHGTEDKSIAALVYDGLGASIAELIDGATADVEVDSASKSR